MLNPVDNNTNFGNKQGQLNMTKHTDVYQVKSLLSHFSV